MEADKTKEQLINELTELRQENSELEEKYRFLYESHPAINMIIGTDGVIKDINDTLIRKYGFTRDEIIGKHILKFVISNQRKKVAAQLRRDFKGEFTSEIEVDIYAKDRSIHTILFSAGNAILKEKGQLAGILITGIDITERKKIEKKLIHLSNALQVSSDSIVISDLEGKITDVNEVTLKMYGTDNKADLIGKSTFDIIAPEDREKAIAGTKEVMEKGYIKDREYHIVIKDGSKIPVEMSTSIMKGSDGEPIGFVAVSRDITERLSAEQAGKRVGETLRRTEDIYRRAIASADAVPYQLHYVSNSYEYMGEGIVQLTGYTAEEMNPTLWRKMIKQSILYGDAEELEWDEAVRQTRAGKFKRWRSDNLIATRDGQERWIADASVEIRNTEGVSIGSVGIFMDITERKRVEEELHKSEVRFRAIVEDQTEIICRYLADGTLTFVNNAYCHYFGKERERLIGHSFMPSIPEEDREIVRQKFSSLSSENPIATYEYRVLLPDNRIRWQQWTDRAIYDEKDNLVEYQSVGRDITEHKQVVEELKSAHEYARNLIDSSLDMIIAVDKERRIVEFNKAAEETFGHAKAEVLGKHIDILYANPAEGLKTHTITRRTGRFSEEIMNKRKNGETFPAFLSASVLRDASGEFLGIMGVSRDITKLKQSEKERENLQAQLLQSQKVEAIGKLASGIAHDFNNLLTIILGYSQLASDRLEEGNPIRKDIEKIKGAGERAAILIRQLLIFSRKQVLKPKILDLNVVVSDVEKMLGRLIGEDIEFITVLESKLNQVKADRGQIEQVLINLVVNARDAMPEGGRISIQTQNVTFDKDVCKINPESMPGKFVCVNIKDTGFGIRKKILNHIFEPFFSTKKSGEGTGLGLSVVYGIVKQHGGWINVYSEPGRGSTFKFYLPAILAAPEEEVEKAVSIETLKGSDERILLVEDEEDVRQFAVTVLREYGYIVFDVASGKDAQRVFENENGNFDLVFSDVVLPDKTGLQLVDEMLLVKPDLRVLLSSGYSNHKSQWAEIKKRRLQFLQKPYGVSDLLKSIKEMIPKEVS